MTHESPVSTKDRILDTAERLFGERGFSATSLRDITKAAGVNLAAVNYHFQSKEALIQAILARRIEPVNKLRFEMLDAFAAEARGGPLPIDKLLRAFIDPMLRLLYLPEGACAGRLIGRLLVEPGDLFEHFFNEQIAHVRSRFVAEMTRTLPDLSEAEISWRILFMIGAVGHTLGGLHRIRVVSRGQCDSTDVDALSTRLIAFLAAGFGAPVPQAQKGETPCSGSR